ncbi:MAG TPA: cytochrome c peroxidase [Chitinophagaceae bacterium]
MKKKAYTIAILALCIVLPSFFIAPALSPAEKVKAYYADQFKQLSLRLQSLQQAVLDGSNESVLKEDFSAARVPYKKLETFVEYYFELDAPQFNGLATDFVEEEDPATDHEPQGFQMIESFLYPHYDMRKKKQLLLFVHKLLDAANGLGNNTALFQPDQYLPDALMEELYRVLALGLSGFDSPLALHSLPEAKASLQSIRFVLQTYEGTMKAAGVTGSDTALVLLTRAIAYLDNHNSFNHFDRAAFITGFLNPLCNWLGKAIVTMKIPENPARYSLIKKTSHLFDEKSLQGGVYLKDDIASAAKIALGRQLFYEPLLSANGKRSCAGCHQPAKAFTDGLPKALQLDEHSLLPRNTPTLWNAGLQKSLFYDSRQDFLDNLILEVIGNEKEMNRSADQAAIKISARREYVALYRKAYPAEDTVINGAKIANAIAMYVRTLVSYNARFDQYMRGDKQKMSPEEIGGFNLFMGKAKCATCHYVPLFNGSKPPNYYYQESEVIGVPGTGDLLHPVPDTDPGRYAILPKEFLKNAFKTPTLRNIALTAPYMHNGVFKTLEEVVEFYNKGGGVGIGLKVPNQTLPATALGLTAIEKKQLIAFLHTLTDVDSIRVN